MNELNMTETITATTTDEAKPSQTIQTQPERTQQNQTTEAQTVHQQGQDLAIQLGEDPSTLRARTDAQTVLRHMQDGVVINLVIQRPRFTATLTADDLGLETTSPQAEEVIESYFKRGKSNTLMGRKSLLPKDLLDGPTKRDDNGQIITPGGLRTVEQNLRYNLYHYSVPSHWGKFVPATRYKEWKRNHERLVEEFEASRDRIIGEYPQIVERVIEEHRPLAEDAWKRITASKAIRNQEEEHIVARLHAEEGKERFIENYLDTVRAAMPTLMEIEDGFVCDVERSYIPLPSLLAKDMENADRLYRERAIQDAETRTRLAEIEAQHQAELQKLSWEQQQERAKQYQRLKEERDRQEEQRQMELDLLNDARRQKERLIQEFYTNVIEQINTFLEKTTDDILTSLENNQGILRGPSSRSLKMLVEQLKRMNFIEDETIESQIQRLNDVLPTDNEQTNARKGLAKIDTTRITQVVRAVHEEAERLKVDLETAPRVRKVRRGPTPAAPVVNLDNVNRRNRRAGFTFSEPQPEEEPATSGRRQRRSL